MLSELYLAWVAGEPEAACALADYCEEYLVKLHPFEVGECWLFEQQTLYYVGRVVEVGPCWVRLEKASWVHRTGRKSTLFAVRSFLHAGWPAGENRPRTEYVGDYVVFTTSTSGAAPWLGTLPEAPVQ